jgi:hypothetical protein
MATDDRNAPQSRLNPRGEDLVVPETPARVSGQVHGPDGRFVRRRKPWTPETWDDGWLNDGGYFMVCRPDYPRARRGGYAKRSHVVWWLETGQVLEPGLSLHHRDGNKSNDVVGNLELMDTGDHSVLHNTRPHIICTCEHCGKDYRLNSGRKSMWKRTGAKPRFCSLACFHAHPRSEESSRRRSKSMKAAWAKRRRKQPCE